MSIGFTVPVTRRMQQERLEKQELFYIDYGRMSEIDNGRRVFFSREEWFNVLMHQKKQGHKLHMITPNICGCTLQGSFAYD